MELTFMKCRIGAAAALKIQPQEVAVEKKKQ